MRSCLLLVLCLSTAFPAAAAMVSERLFWTDQTRRGVFRSAVDGSGASEIVDTGGAPSGIAANNLFLYWANGQSLFRADLDGSGAKEIVDLVAVFGTGPYGTGSWAPRGVTLADTFVYWVDSEQEGLFRARLDGSVPTRLLDFTTDLGLMAPDYDAVGLASSDTFLYWTDVSADVIVRAELDGANPTVLVTGSTSDAFTGIAVNDTHLFWVDALDGVFRSDLEGGNPVEIIDRSAFFGPPVLREITLDAKTLYVTVDGVSGSSAEGLFSADLSGGGLTQLINLHSAFPAAAGSGPRGVALGVTPPAVPALGGWGLGALAAALIYAARRVQTRAT
ncbi:MAG: hypothetical protein AAF430_01100 [Myxococcota bacterium]